MSAAQYRILSPDGIAREDGQADAGVTAGALVLAPAAGSTLHIPFGQILSVGEPEPYTVRITLADGNAIELSRLGIMRTQLLAGLRDGHAADVAAAAAAVGEAAIFSGMTGSGPVEVRVYEDALLVTLLTDRRREARGRTAAFLDSLLPGLDPMARREAAGRLRDGVAVPVSTLAGIHPDLARTLLQVATLPARRDAVADLACRTDLAIGFKQLVSVRQPATGVTPGQDHAAAPHIGQHDGPGGSFQPGLMGMMAAGVMCGGPTGPGGMA